MKRQNSLESYFRNLPIKKRVDDEIMKDFPAKKRKIVPDRKKLVTVSSPSAPKCDYPFCALSIPVEVKIKELTPSVTVGYIIFAR